MRHTLYYLNLLSASGTLVCCVLPVTLVALGAGSVVAMLATHIPALIWLSANKLWVFGVAAIMLLIAGIVLYRNRNQQFCPTDARERAQCMALNRWNKVLYFGALTIYLVGASVAFVIPLFNSIE